MSNKTDNELLTLAATAVGLELTFSDGFYHEKGTPVSDGLVWNPFKNNDDKYNLAKKLRMTIDFDKQTVCRRMPDHTLIQEFWGGNYGDEAHAIVRAAVVIGELSGSGLLTHTTD